VPLFNKKIIQQHLNPQEIPAAHFTILQNWQNRIAQRDLEKQTELALQGIFMQSLLVDVLGYQAFGQDKTYSIAKEYPIARGAVDLALGQFSNDKKSDSVQAVFELKGAKTKNLDAIMSGRAKSPVQQAWDYARDAKGCQWILVSNYLEIRLYALGETSLIYEQFDLAKLTECDEYARFMLCLHADHLLTGKTKDLLAQSQQADKDITLQFYADYKALREQLITRLITDNPEIAPLELIAPAQKLLDRVLFLAFSEDRGLIPHNSIEQAYKFVCVYDPKPIYHNFKGLFNAIDKGNLLLKVPAYNGGLFAPDKFFDKLLVADELCKGFLELAKYDFNSEISVTVLGHIFEQSIADLEEITVQIQSGKLLQKNAKTTSVTGKRKQYGVVYTPDHITAFIVEHTLGEHLQQRFVQCLSEFGTLKEDGSMQWKRGKQTELKFWYAWQAVLKTIKIVDPACGSGAFLVAAFDVLHAEYQRTNDKIAEITGQPDVFDLNKEILNRNLSGVDLNPESIEITKLSLWLKTAERGKKLATIEQHLQVGNSLGFNAPVNLTGLKDLEGFCWQNNFSKIMQAGGFDVVLGNPPYVRQELLSNSKPYLQQHYAVYHGVVDLYAYFFELGLKLLKPNGMLGFISSSTFFKTSSGEPLRKFLAENATLKKVVDFGDLQVFEGVTTYPAILIFQNVLPTENSEIQMLVLKNELPEKLSEFFAAHHGVMNHAQLRSDSWQLEDVRLNQLRNKLTRGYPTLKDVYGSPFYGIKTGLNEAFVIDAATKEKFHSALYRGVLTGLNEAFVIGQATKNQLIKENPKAAELLKPYLEGKDLKKWYAQPRDLWLILIPKGWTQEKMGGLFDESTSWEWLQTHYSSVAQWLAPFAEAAQKRGDKGDFWWELRACAYYEEFEKPKIVWADIANQNKFFLTFNNYYLANTAYMLPTHDCFLLGWLNSKACNLIFSGLSTMIRGGFFRYIRQYVETLPIPSATDEQKTHLGQLAEQCQTLAEQRYALENKIRCRFFDLGIKKLNQKLEQWWQLDFYTWHIELKKSYKITIPLLEREDWQALFEQAKAQHHTFNLQIATLELQLNTAVYALFGLSDEEIKLIETN
jgi:type I restriction-modification system DNA methylase subunit